MIRLLTSDNKFSAAVVNKSFIEERGPQRSRISNADTEMWVSACVHRGITGESPASETPRLAANVRVQLESAGHDFETALLCLDALQQKERPLNGPRHGL